MIAQIKVLSNAIEIEKAQKEFQSIAQKNQEIDKTNQSISKAKRVDLIELPKIPDAEYKGSDLLIDIQDVKLAFVNSTGEISIKYLGDNFNLIYSDEIWNQLKARFN